MATPTPPHKVYHIVQPLYLPQKDKLPMTCVVGELAARMPSSKVTAGVELPGELTGELTGEQPGGLQCEPTGRSASSVVKCSSADLHFNNHKIRKLARSTLRPFVAILLIFGLLPIHISKGGFSLHPIKSSLLYTIVIQLLVGYLSTDVALSYFRVVNKDADSSEQVDAQMLAALSGVHVMSHAIVVLMWLELPFLGNQLQLWINLAGRCTMTIEPKLSFAVRWIPRFLAFYAFLIAPGIVYLWEGFMVGHGDGLWKQIIAHLFQLVFVTSGCLYFCWGCLLVRDLAATMAALLAKDLSQGQLTARQLEDYRVMWLSFRQLTAILSALPLSIMAVLGYSLTMITLSAYQTVVSLSKGSLWLTLACGSVLLMFETITFFMCDSAQRLTDTMIYGFYEPLEARSWITLAEDLRIEHQQFLQTIADYRPQVSIAGFITLTRATFLGMNAAITTYIIVLFQMRESDVHPTNNSTASSGTMLII